MLQKKSSKVTTELEWRFLTSGYAAGHCVRSLETQTSEGFMDLNEYDNKLRAPRGEELF